MQIGTAQVGIDQDHLFAAAGHVDGEAGRNEAFTGAALASAHGPDRTAHVLAG